MKKTFTFFARTYSKLIELYILLRRRYGKILINANHTGGGYYQGYFKVI